MPFARSLASTNGGGSTPRGGRGGDALARPARFEPDNPGEKQEDTPATGLAQGRRGGWFHSVDKAGWGQQAVEPAGPPTMYTRGASASVDCGHHPTAAAAVAATGDDGVDVQLLALYRTRVHTVLPVCSENMLKAARAVVKRPPSVAEDADDDDAGRSAAQALLLGVQAAGLSMAGVQDEARLRGMTVRMTKLAREFFDAPSEPALAALLLLCCSRCAPLTAPPPPRRTVDCPSRPRPCARTTQLAQRGRSGLPERAAPYRAGI